MAEILDSSSSTESTGELPTSSILVKKRDDFFLFWKGDNTCFPFLLRVAVVAISVRDFADKGTNASHDVGIVIVVLISVAEADSSAKVGIGTVLISQIKAFLETVKPLIIICFSFLYDFETILILIIDSKN